MMVYFALLGPLTFPFDNIKVLFELISLRRVEKAMNYAVRLIKLNNLCKTRQNNTLIKPRPSFKLPSPFQINLCSADLGHLL